MYYLLILFTATSHSLYRLQLSIGTTIHCYFSIYFDIVVPLFTLYTYWHYLQPQLTTTMWCCYVVLPFSVAIHCHYLLLLFNANTDCNRVLLFTTAMSRFYLLELRIDTL